MWENCTASGGVEWLLTPRYQKILKLTKLRLHGIVSTLLVTEILLS